MCMGWGVWVCEALDPKELALLVIVISPPTLGSHVGPLQDQWALLTSRLSAPKLWLFYNSLAHRTSSTLFSLIYQRSVASFVFISYGLCCLVQFLRQNLTLKPGWLGTYYVTQASLEPAAILKPQAGEGPTQLEWHLWDTRFFFNQHLSKSKDRTWKEAVIRKQEKLAEQ